MQAVMAMILVLGIIPVLVSGEAAAKSDFVLEDYFKGETVAKGVFVSKIGRSRREFDVFLTGTLKGDTFSLREDFVYADGERDTKTWVFRKIGEGRYTGTREDVLGRTTLVVSGNMARFEYDVLVPRKGKKPIKVHFKDRMTLLPDGTVKNRARISKFGFPVGKVRVNFKRGRDIDQVPIPDL